MGKGGKVGSKQYRKRRIQSKDKGSDESDEDYTVGEDEVFNESEEYCSSFAGEESEESLGEFEEEEEEEKVRKIGRLKGQKAYPDRKENQVGKAHKKRRGSYKVVDDEDFEVEDEDEDEEDYDYDDDDDEVEEEEIAQKRRASHKVEDDEDFEGEDDYDDNDDDDDEEFAPDEIDLDDEDELAVRKKNKKVQRPSLQGTCVVKGRKRKRSSRAMKNPVRKNLTKRRGLRRKSAAGNDRAFTEKNPVVQERSKRSSGRRKRRFMAYSDSDFVSSGSSDKEYSISEEEREQVREASKFCRDLTASLRDSSTKRIQEGVLGQQRKLPGRKGKEKVEELKIEAGKQVCGICLSEEGKTTVRGTLNCCSHYFCFPCIMEWSKVESRCPLCKQRFTNISKPTRLAAGFDFRTVVIQVPERDQVYQPSEEELRGYLDPYENVICTECQQGGDDAFMLLCDICDSPAHTYCIGLGREVPEGNWYCEGCRPTALGYSNPQAPNHTPGNRTINNLSGENVREAIDLNTEYVPETPSTQGTGVFSSPRHPVRDSQAGSPRSGVGVSTVSERRRILQRHHLLFNGISPFGGRTNWVSAATSGNTILGSQIERGRETAFQHPIMPEMLASQQTISQGRLHDNFPPSLQSRDLSWARPSHSRDQLIRGQTSTSANGSANRMLQAGLAGISRGINSRSGYEQLHPCSSSRSSIADDSLSSYGYREVSYSNVEKEQVQSMVRSHLKSLSREMELGHSTFKTIARNSTHTILAAFGLKHRESEVCPVQLPSICAHVGGTAGGDSGGLMKGCCSSCFDSLVRHVVREITNTRVPPPFRVRD